MNDSRTTHAQLTESSVSTHAQLTEGSRLEMEGKGREVEGNNSGYVGIACSANATRETANHAMPRATRNQQLRAVAFLVHSIREDWHEAGIMATLKKLNDRDIVDLATAALKAARRTDQRTPEVIAMSGSHWSEAKHAEPTPQPPSRRSGIVCWGCNRDQAGHDALAALGDDHAWVSHQEWRERGPDHCPTCLEGEPDE